MTREEFIEKARAKYGDKYTCQLHPPKGGCLCKNI